MEKQYGDIVIRRMNKSGFVCLFVIGIILILFAVMDALWINGLVSLPLILQAQYQPIYILWFIFMIVCLGIDKVTINDKGFVISTLFAKKEDTEKSAIAYVLENDDKIFFVPIVATLGIYNPVDFKFLKQRPGVLIISSKYKEKVIERGYNISTSV